MVKSLPRKIVFIACTLVLAGFFGCGQGQDSRLKEYASLNPQRDFTLTDQDGQLFNLKDYRGQVVLLFFGYLSCPDICPMTLSKISRAYALLGPLKSKVLTLFVSVDPARDTPQRMKEYLKYFKLRSKGLSGSKEQIDAVVNAYKASYEKVETTSAMGYLFNHSDYIYVLDQQGMVRFLARAEDKSEKIAEVIQTLLK